jgi:predicted nucleic acid-binding protein
VADEPGLWTSRLASVEVVRAAVIANPAEGLERARSLLEGCALIDVDAEILEHASRLVNRRLRTLDAIHLASALLVGPEAVVAYDSRLLEAAELAGLRSVSPS